MKGISTASNRLNPFRVHHYFIYIEICFVNFSFQKSSPRKNKLTGRGQTWMDNPRTEGRSPDEYHIGSSS